jgi:hypothetical protein
MGISSVHWLASIAAALSFALVFFVRWARKHRGPEAHIGWALAAALGSIVLVESGFLLYRVWRYGSLDGVESLWLYAYCGGLTGCAAGLAAIVQAFKAD